MARPMVRWKALGRGTAGPSAARCWLTANIIYRGLGDYGQAENEWLAYFKLAPNDIGLTTLLDLANQADPNWRDKLSEEFWQRVVSS